MPSAQPLTDIMAPTVKRSAASARPRAVALEVGGIPYRVVNERLDALAESGVGVVLLRGVDGQRYLGTNLKKPLHILVEGVPGQDLGAFMDGPIIEVLGNAQDGCGNTMNSGAIVIHGSAGDILGHSMRGGKIFVRDNVGYRVGIHMKEYESVKPTIVIGGTAQHFLGEYMAGGVLVVLGRNLDPGEPHPSHYVGTGMHGGVIYIRGEVRRSLLGKEVGVRDVDDADMALLGQLVSEYARRFRLDAEELLRVDDGRAWLKLLPTSKRPYGRLYAY